jgi:hypothetical protein
LGAEFLQDEEGARANEGVRWELGGDDQLDVTVTRVEATKEIQHLARLGDEVADVTKLIGEALELGAVVVDREVVLLCGTQFGLKVDRAVYLVVEEEALIGVSQGESGEARPTNNVEDGLGDSGGDPVDDTGVNHAPLAPQTGSATERDSRGQTR